MSSGDSAACGVQEYASPPHPLRYDDPGHSAATNARPTCVGRGRGTPSPRRCRGIRRLRRTRVRLTASPPAARRSGALCGHQRETDLRWSLCGHQRENRPALVGAWHPRLAGVVGGFGGCGVQEYASPALTPCGTTIRGTLRPPTRDRPALVGRVATRLAALSGDSAAAAYKSTPHRLTPCGTTIRGTLRPPTREATCVGRAWHPVSRRCRGIRRLRRTRVRLTASFPAVRRSGALCGRQRRDRPALCDCVGEGLAPSQRLAVEPR